MTRDARLHQRASPKQLPDGTHFLLSAKGRLCRLDEVYDVSLSGMGVYLPRLFSVGTAAFLTYRELHWELTIAAKIAWCKPVSVPQDNVAVLPHLRYRAGIEYDAKDENAVRSNELFFFALRAHFGVFTLSATLASNH